MLFLHWYCISLSAQMYQTHHDHFMQCEWHKRLVICNTPTLQHLPRATKRAFIIDQTSCGVTLEETYVVSPLFPLSLNFNAKRRRVWMRCMLRKSTKRATRQTQHSHVLEDWGKMLTAHSTFSPISEGWDAFAWCSWSFVPTESFWFPVSTSTGSCSKAWSCSCSGLWVTCAWHNHSVNVLEMVACFHLHNAASRGVWKTLVHASLKITCAIQGLPAPLSIVIIIRDNRPPADKNTMKCHNRKYWCLQTGCGHLERMHF